MLRSSRLLAIPMIAVGLLLVASASEAQAQVRVQIGGFGLNGGGAHRGVSVYRGGHRFTPNRVYSAYRPNYGYGHHIYHAPRIHAYGHHGYGHGIRHGYYHDTTHYDYHPPQIYRHGNHYDFQPGHYDLHRSGHFHY